VTGAVSPVWLPSAVFASEHPVGVGSASAAYHPGRSFAHKASPAARGCTGAATTSRRAVRLADPEAAPGCRNHAPVARQKQVVLTQTRDIPALRYLTCACWDRHVARVKASAASQDDTEDIVDHGWKRWLGVFVAVTVLAGGLASIFHRGSATVPRRRSWDHCSGACPCGTIGSALETSRLANARHLLSPRCDTGCGGPECDRFGVREIGSRSSFAGMSSTPASKQPDRNPVGAGREDFCDRPAAYPRSRC
jgi:hypothetical protein